MICPNPNCAYDNMPGVKNCLRCGTPLPDNAVSSVPTDAYAPSANQKQTVLGSAAELAAKSSAVAETPVVSSNRTVFQKIVRCPNCGTPTLGNEAKCPSCGADMPVQAATEEKKPHTPSAGGRPASVYAAAAASDNRSTIYRPLHKEEKPAPIVEELPKCSLCIIYEDEELEQEAQPTCYEGKQVELNRENTEPSNRTITSKVQATLTHEDGHWYIENNSEMRTTYVAVSRKMELHPGDIIIMGDRRFVFAEEK